MSQCVVPGSFCVVYDVDKVALGRDLLCALRLPPVFFYHFTDCVHSHAKNKGSSRRTFEYRAAPDRNSFEVLFLF